MLNINQPGLVKIIFLYYLKVSNIFRNFTNWNSYVSIVTSLWVGKPKNSSSPTGKMNFRIL